MPSALSIYGKGSDGDTVQRINVTNRRARHVHGRRRNGPPSAHLNLNALALSGLPPTYRYAHEQDDEETRGDVGGVHSGVEESSTSKWVREFPNASGPYAETPCSFCA